MPALSLLVDTRNTWTMNAKTKNHKATPRLNKKR